MAERFHLDLILGGTYGTCAVRTVSTTTCSCRILL